jgi:poly(A) polymerase
VTLQSLDLSGSILHILNVVRSTVPGGVPVYLVGGAVRDILLGRDVHDLDFVLPRGGLGAARAVADKLKGAYYPLDRERETGRVVWTDSTSKRWHLDFAAYHNSDLEGDLTARDLTINAIAIDIDHSHTLIDPLGGAADLLARYIRACTPASFTADPLRVLRAVRISVSYKFRILPETLQGMRAAAAGLGDVSAERLRDEIFRMMDCPQPSACVQVLDTIGGVKAIFPELDALRGLKQSLPHVNDAWIHTLDVISRLEQVLSVLSVGFDLDSTQNIYTAMLSHQLGRYRQQITSQLAGELSEGRNLRSLLFFAALYHDVGKPETRSTDPDGRIRYFDHDLVGAEIIDRRCQWLHLSNLEIAWLKLVVRYHLRPLLLTQDGVTPSRRAIYRFFRQAKDSGIGVCLLSLADVWGTYGPGMPAEVWGRYVEVVRSLLEGWWERPAEVVTPPIYVNGRDLIEEFSLQAGPIIGKLLDEIREAAAVGVIQDRQQALDLARSILEGVDQTKEEI